VDIPSPKKKKKRSRDSSPSDVKDCMLYV
jgi:hypothetical protein